MTWISVTCNKGRNFKFYYLQGQNLKIFLIFTENQDKIFLILLITGGRGVELVYMASTRSCPPAPLPRGSMIWTSLKIVTAHELWQQFSMATTCMVYR